MVPCSAWGSAVWLLCCSPLQSRSAAGKEAIGSTCTYPFPEQRPSCLSMGREEAVGVEGPQSCSDPIHLPYSTDKGVGPQKVSDVLQAKEQVITSPGVLRH